MYNEAFNAVRDRLVGLLESADLPDDKRRKVNDLLVQHRKVRQYMEAVMKGGEMAAKQIEQERTFGQKLRDSLNGSNG